MEILPTEMPCYAINYSKLDSFKNSDAPSTDIFSSAWPTLIHVYRAEIFENDGFLFTYGRTKMKVS